MIDMHEKKDIVENNNLLVESPLARQVENINVSHSESEYYDRPIVTEVREAIKNKINIQRKKAFKLFLKHISEIKTVILLKILKLERQEELILWL